MYNIKHIYNSGWGNNMKKSFVIIDMLNDFVDEHGSLYIGVAGRQIIPFIRMELEKARKQGWPVIYICDHHRQDDSEFQMFPPHCIAGTDGANVCSELAPVPGDFIIFKRRFSGFYGTDLDICLREMKIEELVLTGVCTNICVLYTAVDARMRNYRVTVLKNGVASFSDDAHRFALQEMEKTLGVVVV